MGNFLLWTVTSPTLGFANGLQAIIFDLLLAVNSHAYNGVLYDEDHDGDTNSFPR